MPAQNAIETFSLTKHYPQPRGWRRLLTRPAPPAPALHDLFLQIHTGELFGLLGPNGAGKTTLLKLLSTLVVPTSGAAYINGYSLDETRAIKSMIGLMTSDERSFYWRLSGRDNLEFFAALHGLTGVEAAGRISEVLELVELQDVADKRFLSYSTGMRQRLSLARALLNRPKMLFLDEPTRGLDPSASARLHALIRNLHTVQGVTILLTTHNLTEAAALCQRIAILDRGNLRACGTLSELRRELQLGSTYQIQVYLPVQAIAHDLSSLNLRLSGELPGYQTTPADRSPPGQFQFTFSNPDGARLLDSTLRQIQAAGLQVSSVERLEHSLDAIFAHHTSAERSPAPREASAFRSTQLRSKHPRAPIPPALPLLRLAAAFLRRDFRNEASYRLAFLLQFVNIFFSIGMFYFLAQLVGPAALPYLSQYGGDYFAFVLIGIAFSGYFGVGLSSFAASLREAQTTGTLEAMLTTPTGLSAIILSSSLWDYLLTTLRVAVFLLIGGIFLEVDLSRGNLPVALLSLSLTVITFASLGIISASFIMVLKRGDPIAWLFNIVSTLLGGVYYPIEVLPGWLQFFSRLLPVTYALEAMRLSLLQGAGFQDLLPQLLPLFLFSLILLPLSLLAFQIAVQRARIEGSLTHY